MAKENESKFVWMDGKLLPYAQAQVPVLSHTLHYGTGAFEGIRAYEGPAGTAMFRGVDHFNRLHDSVKVLGLRLEYTVGDLVRATAEVVAANELRECYIRPLAYIGDETRGLKLPATTRVRVAIAAWSWGKYMGADGQDKGIQVMISSYRRFDTSTFMPWAKLCGNYVTSVLARRQATHCGADEAIMLDAHGYVAEGSGENLFLVKNGEIITPPHGAILPGLTRDSVIQMARSLGYTVREEPITRNQLYFADELFFTGTAVEVTPIVQVDKYEIGSGKPGPIGKRLIDTFFKCVRGELPEFKNWLDVLPR